MTNEIWEARRQRLSDEVRAAALALLDHTSAASFCLPLNDGVVAAGAIESVAALSGGCPPSTALQPIDTAPVDGTPILVKVRAEQFLPDSAATWAGLFFVARNQGDASEWCYAGPVGCGGFPDAWLEGWMPLPAPDDC